MRLRLRLRLRLRDDEVESGKKLCQMAFFLTCYLEGDREAANSISPGIFFQNPGF